MGYKAHHQISTHTPTQGVTHSTHAAHAAESNFYSHAHAGRDNIMEMRNNHDTISTHTPTQGVTGKIKDHCTLPEISTHTPTQGVTSLILLMRRTSLISTHTPTQGVTIYAFVSPLSFVIFLLTRPRRA